MMDMMKAMSTDGSSLEYVRLQDADDDDTDEQAAVMGDGSFGVTYQMRNKVDKRLYAVKMIGVKRFEKNGGNPAKLSQEAKQLAKLDHPNIVRYFYNFETRNSHGKVFAIVMELLTEGSFATASVRSYLRSSSRAGSSKWRRRFRTCTRSRCYTETSSRTTYCSTRHSQDHRPRPSVHFESKYRDNQCRRHATVHEPGEGQRRRL